MHLKRALAVRVLAVVVVAVTSIGFVLSGPRLRAQNPPAPDQKTSGPAELALPSPVEPMPTDPPPAPTRVLPSPSSAATGPLADPEAAANGFVERSTKEAEDAIKALTKEAESLRARLQKVESGLARWQSVKQSLESNGVHATWRSRTPAGPRQYTEVLEPVSVEETRASRQKPSIDIEVTLPNPRPLQAVPDKGGSPFQFIPGPAIQPKPDAVAPPPIAPTPKPSEALQKK